MTNVEIEGKLRASYGKLDMRFRDGGGEARGVPEGLWGSRKGIKVSEEGTHIVTGMQEEAKAKRK